MKILLVQNRFYPAIGGGEKHTCLLSKYLAKKGHEVTVYTTTSLSKDDVFSMALSPPFFIKPKMKANLPKEEVIENVIVKRFDMKLRFWSFNWIPEMFKELKKTAQEFDIIHAHGYHIPSALASCYYAKKSKKTIYINSTRPDNPWRLALGCQII